MGKSCLNRFGNDGHFVRIAVLILIGITGWGQPLGAATDGEKIVYRLKWLKNASVVGDIYAEEAGLFEAAGLSVTVKAGGPERDAIKELELGYAQFGVASADQVVRALAKGAPVIVIAQLFQTNPLQWIYHGDEPIIESIGDLKGKTIGVTFGGNDETIMRTLLGSAGLTEKEVRFFSVRYDYTPFYNRQVAFWPVYRNAQAILIAEKLKAAGKSVRFLEPARFGIKFAANSVVTSTQLMENRPQTVRRFLTTLIAGWREAIDPMNREKALAYIRGFERDTAPDIIEKQLDATRMLVQPYPNIPIGTIDETAWREAERMMRDLHQIPGPVDIQKALRPVDISGPAMTP